MIEGAERDGQLRPGSILVEPTSGNTGIGVALVGRLKGYKVRIVMPENMSEERKKLIRALGADLVLTPAAESIEGAVRRARQMAAEDPDVFIPQQFENPENPRIHYETTARELWRQMTGDVACFVAGVGSGGTLQGVGRFLREHKPGVRIVAVEPKNVSALLGHEPGLHQIQGIGDGFIPPILDVSLVDEVVEVTDEDVRHAMWNARGIAYNPDAAFVAYARAHDLGGPVTNEMDVNDTVRCQGFERRIVKARIGDWQNIEELAW